MLPLGSSPAESVLDALVHILILLRPGPQPKPGGDQVGRSKEGTRRYLRQLRHHFRTCAPLVSALREAAPIPFGEIQPLLKEHRLLLRLTHQLCVRIRESDLRGAREIARMLLAVLLNHDDEERELLERVVGDMAPAAVGRFKEALCRRVIRDTTDSSARGTSGNRRRSRGAS